MTDHKIADYALIGDCHSAALVSFSGSIDWLCLPRFDSPSIFGRLLDSSAGHWQISPCAPARSSRRYLENTMVLQTTFSTATGIVHLTDAMCLGAGEREHDIGCGAPHCLLRSLTCTEGEMELEVDFVPRPEYGLVIPLLRLEGRSILGKGGAAVFRLSTSAELEMQPERVVGRISLQKGDCVQFAMLFKSSSEDPPSIWTQAEIGTRLADTVEGWQSWSHIHQHYDGPWRDLVLHSGRVLQALTYYPTGAIVAAPTTSLPEVVGGDRNWDYRFTWVRDASFTMEALWVAACPEESKKFFSFLASTALTQVNRGDDLQIMFGIGGEHDLTERTLPHLAGWRGSLPVRIGNDAWRQRQLDVYGELLGAVFLLSSRLKGVDSSTREFLMGAVEGAASRWKQQDQGIWEVRGEPRDFLYSKLMCWVALDRAIKLADFLEAGERVSHWQAVRDEISDTILTNGWSETMGSFTQAFGSNDLDASSLMIAIVGFLPATDPRVTRTIDATIAHLTDEHGLVRRYSTDDGLSGTEGSFLLCTFWLAHAQALAGRVEDAKGTFERAIAFRNDLGLLAEEVDPASKELMGNYPQAFSHIGLINAAWAIRNAAIESVEEDV